MSEVNLGVLKTDQVNIAMHGHNPLLSDVVVRSRRRTPSWSSWPARYGANGHQHRRPVLHRATRC